MTTVQVLRTRRGPVVAGEKSMDGEKSYHEIQALVGRTVGHIVYFSFSYETYVSRVLVAAAQAMWESLRSAWMLVEIWNNGTTVWRSPEGSETATVTSGGEIQIQVF